MLRHGTYEQAHSGGHTKDSEYTFESGPLYWHRVAVRIPISHCSGYTARDTIAVRRRATRPTDCLPLYLAGPRVGMCTRVSLLAAAAFLSARFCFSVLPDFLLLD